MHSSKKYNMHIFIGLHGVTAQKATISIFISVQIDPQQSHPTLQSATGGLSTRV